MNSIMKRTLLVTALMAATAASAQQALVPPASLRQQLTTDWATYAGDYTNQRFSRLTQVTKQNVKQLTLAWVARPNSATRGAITGGEGKGDIPASGTSMKGAVLEANGILYATSPDHAWAIDGRDGRELWHYFWKTRGGTHLTSRGSAIWNNTFLFLTPDNYMVALDAGTGKELWHVEIADFNQQYFTTSAPIVIGDHIIVGTGNDSDAPGFLQSYDPRTGKRNWIFYTVPMQPGDAGLDTWPSLDAARHGGGHTWMPGAYDPETDLYIFGTGNPSPAYTGIARPGDNLFTCALVAVKVSTGKMAWYYQTSPHDTHDWDSSQSPILFDATINGKPRKLVSTAARNGYFFTVDRVTGEHLVTTQFGRTVNWAKGLRQGGQPERDPSKDAQIAGTLVSPTEEGVVNFHAPAFNPDLNLFYVSESNSFNIVYLTDPDPRGSMGLGGKRRAVFGYYNTALLALDARTGKPAWRHEWPQPLGLGGGLLNTRTGVLFTGDGNGNFVALDSANGAPLWHTRIGNISNAPETYEIDGKQYVLVGVGDTLYAFVLY
jgi:alcohol dehydrogenase (cytochrome c)